MTAVTSASVLAAARVRGGTRFAWARAAAQSSSGGRVRAARYSVVEKNSRDVAVCNVDTSVGSRSFTVMPPSKACANTSATANHPTRRSERCSGRALRSSSVARSSVRTTTVPAARRWLCSMATPPSIFGIIVP